MAEEKYLVFLEFQVGEYEIRHTLAAFSDHMSTNAGGLKKDIPYRKLLKLRWDSGRKLVIEWNEAGQFQIFVVFGEQSKLEEIVNLVKKVNPAVIEDQEAKQKEMSNWQDSQATAFILLCMMLFTGAVIWGARYLGWIPMN